MIIKKKHTTTINHAIPTIVNKIDLMNIKMKNNIFIHKNILTLATKNPINIIIKTIKKQV